jgi:hypothetical protein
MGGGVAPSVDEALWNRAGEVVVVDVEVGERDEAVEEAVGDGGEAVVVEEEMLERGEALEGGERNGEGGRRGRSSAPSPPLLSPAAASFSPASRARDCRSSGADRRKWGWLLVVLGSERENASG